MQREFPSSSTSFCRKHAQSELAEIENDIREEKLGVRKGKKNRLGQRARQRVSD